jgi:hypothetical protein
MNFFPDLKLIADAKSLDIYAQAIGQGAAQLINTPNKDSDEFSALKSYTLRSIGEFKEILNKIEVDIA